MKALDSVRYCFDKEKILALLQTKDLHPTKLMYQLELSPGQMSTFWRTEPSVERLIRFGGVLGVNPLEYVKKIG